VAQPTIEDLLNEVNYSVLLKYAPDAFSLQFVNFIKLVSAEFPEENESPVIHLMMLDKLPTPSRRTINLCFRGSAKTTLFSEYLVLFIGVFGKIEGFGDVPAGIFVGNSMDKGVAQLRKNIELKYNNSKFLQYWIPEARFRDDHITLTNRDGHRFHLQMYGAQSSVRGSRDGTSRPVIAILDDLIKDDKDAASPTIMSDIRNLISKEIPYALHPTRHKIIWNGTPFNKNDPLIEAVESGNYDVNVWPVCEEWPCTREEFRGAWPERFTYEYCLDQSSTSNSGFMQEMMLRITNEENQLVRPVDITWGPAEPHPLPQKYTYYITTDFATKASLRNDYSVIFVWAYGNDGKWRWVEGVVKRQTMDVSMKDVFRLVEKYKPLGVTVEVSGQQYGFVSWMKDKMVENATWFNIIETRPVANKLAYFQAILPQLKGGNIIFPSEFKNTPELKELMHEYHMATPEGLKSKQDDCIDGTSRLSNIVPVKPGIMMVEQDPPRVPTMWDTVPHSEPTGLASYIV
jgi:predicted phage terminase large subunit-like protein